MIHGHGNDGCFYKKKIIADFSSNVSPWGAPASLIKHVQNSLGRVDNYPEPGAESLADDLGAFHGVSAGGVLPVNGATEAFYLIAQAFREKNSIVVCPTFSEYEDACRIHQHVLSFIMRNELMRKDLSGVDLVWLCNPNNPTGELFQSQELETFFAHYPAVTFVIDEAYIDFTLNGTSVVSLIPQYPNVLVVKSLTKNFCIPGLRLGYLTGNESVVKNISRGKMPWTVNSLAVEAGKYILKHRGSLLPDMEMLAAYTSVLIQTLKKIPALKVQSTVSNFFLCQVSGMTAEDLKNRLIHEYGILIRNADNFRGLDRHTFRIATQLPEKNRMLVKALEDIFEI